MKAGGGGGMGRLAGSVPGYKAPAPLCPPVRPILPALGPEDRECWAAPLLVS